MLYQFGIKLIKLIDKIDKFIRRIRKVEWQSFKDMETIVGYYNDLIVSIDPYNFEGDEGLMCKIERKGEIDVLSYRRFISGVDIEKAKKEMEKFVRLFYKVS